MTRAGWYDDPAGPGNLRYWDGSTWTEHVQPVPPPVAWGEAPDDPHGGVPAMVHPGYGSDVAAAEPEDTYLAEPAGFGPGDWTRHPGGPPPVAGFDADWLATPLEPADFGAPEPGRARSWRRAPAVAVVLAVAALAYVRLAEPTDSIEQRMAAALYAKSQKDGTGFSHGDANCVARRVWAKGDQDEIRAIADDGRKLFDLERPNSLATDEAIVGGLRTCLDDDQIIALAGKGFEASRAALGDSWRCFVVQVYRQSPLADVVAATHDPESTSPATARVAGRALDACEVGMPQLLAVVDVGSDAGQRACVAGELAPAYATSGQLMAALHPEGPGEAAVNAALAACPS